MHPDTAALRRYLVDEGILDREHGEYWRTGGTFDPDASDASATVRAMPLVTRRSQRPPARERHHAQQARTPELDVVPAGRGAVRGARRGRPRQRLRGSSCSPVPGRGFCSGLDLHDRGIPPNTQDLGFSRLAMRSMSYMSDVVPAMRGIPQPIIAAINGPAYGGGMCLTLGADLRYAAESAVFCSAGIINGLTSSRARRDVPAAPRDRHVERGRAAADRPQDRRDGSAAHRPRVEGRTRRRARSTSRSTPPRR